MWPVERSLERADLIGESNEAEERSLFRCEAIFVERVRREVNSSVFRLLRMREA